MSVSTWESLPDQCLRCIVMWLDTPMDVNSFAAVNKRCRRIGFENRVWRHLVVHHMFRHDHERVRDLLATGFDIEWRVFARQSSRRGRLHKAEPQRPRTQVRALLACAAAVEAVADTSGESIGESSPVTLDTVTNGASKRRMCERCHRPSRTCLCSSLPDVPFNNRNVRLILLVHPTTHLGNGTARIALLLLQHATVIVDSDFRAGRYPVLDAALSSGRSVFLFPHSRSVTVNTLSDSEVAASLPSLSLDTRPASADDPLTLIAIDATWATAQRTIKWNPRLIAHIPLVQIDLPGDDYGEFHSLMREPERKCLSTAEAVAHALVALDADMRRVRLVDAVLAPLRLLIAFQKQFQYETEARREQQQQKKDQSQGKGAQQ